MAPLKWEAVVNPSTTATRVRSSAWRGTQVSSMILSKVSMDELFSYSEKTYSTPVVCPLNGFDGTLPCLIYSLKP